MEKRYYWDIAGMTSGDILDGGWFELVDWDELGFSTISISEEDLENEMQYFADYNGWSEEDTREYFRNRVIDSEDYDRAWERISHGGRETEHPAEE